MKYEAILFDLDGTLLPMDNDEFTKGYLNLLARSVAHLGYKADELVPAMWKGVGAMVKNDGSRKNSDAFWEVFSSFFGEKVYSDIPVFDNFYKTEFHKARELTVYTGNSKKAVELARRCAEKVVVATNPFFPEAALHSRLSWVDLKYEDFDLVTDYENSHFCKPNTKYYLEIAEKLNLDPRRCLMVGNNTEEDIIAAEKAGMDTYLITDYLITNGEMPSCKKGSLEDFIAFLGE